MKAFISYSHRDERALERLHTHLAMLRREKQLVAWFDREILAGGDIDKEIQLQLEQCDIFLALVSPDFLNSDYCYEKEMHRAIERTKTGELIVVPIVVEPCDWKSSPFRQYKALPKDGKPISEWVNENTAYQDIVAELRRILQSKLKDNSAVKAEGVPGFEPAIHKKYRIKRDFDKIDRSDFRSTAFQNISAYFEKSINEINQVEGLRGRFDKTGPKKFTCTAINKRRERNGAAYITIHESSGSKGFGDIYYTFSENSPENTANGWFSVESDEYELFLNWNSFRQTGQDKRMDSDQAAKALWEEFLENAGIDYD